MTNESLRPARARILDIVIASLIGGILGAIFAWIWHPDVLIVDRLHANKIIVTGHNGMVSIDGDNGISLDREDYAVAQLWFHEPGTGSPGTGGPVLFIAGKDQQAFKATPSGQEIVHFKSDERDGK